MNERIRLTSAYRHGWKGRYTSFIYPSGASGCVTMRTPDGPWVVACHPHLGDFPTALAAAKAEAAYVSEREALNTREEA
jgi:hypothetical protein